MASSVNVTKVSGSEAEIGTLLTFANLVETDAFCEALLNDISSASYDEAHRSLGLTRISLWIQRDPDALITMWEGRDVETVLERYAASSNPFLGKWRGHFRVWSGPQEAESFWDASHHRLLSWATDEEGAESEVTVYRDPIQVEAYRRFCLDLRQPALMGILDRVRRRQGFTRIETWHQRSNGNDVVLTVVEAHDLNAAIAQLRAEDNELDERVMKLVRNTILQTASPPTVAKLLARWRA